MRLVRVTILLADKFRPRRDDSLIISVTNSPQIHPANCLAVRPLFD
jgi:hypothetical protein